MRIWRRAQSLLHRESLQRELAEELEAHRQEIEDELINQGMAPAEARHAAALRLGNQTSFTEQSRDAWSFAALESVWQDLRFGLRALRQNKPFSAAAILTIAVGLGLNCVLFTLFNAYVLTPLSVRDPYSLYQVSWIAKRSTSNKFTLGQLAELQQRTDLFDEVFATEQIASEWHQKLVLGEIVSGNYFAGLGIPVVRGRGLSPEDDANGTDQIVVISDRFWKSALGSDPSAIGREVEFRGARFTVVGVAGPAYSGIGDTPVDFWAPLSLHGQLHAGHDLRSEEDKQGQLRLVGRLRPGVTPEQAAAGLAAFCRRAAGDRDDAETVRARLISRATILPLNSLVLTEFSPLFVAFFVVLLTCCANVSNLLLARSIARRREMGVRLSLGAGARRVLRQLLTESALISALAAVLGLVLTHVFIRAGQKWLLAIVPAEYASHLRFVPLSLDHRIVIFTVLAATVTTIAFGFLPGIQASRTGLMDALRDEPGAVRSSRLRGAFVALQVTVSALFLILALTLFRNADNIRDRETGLDVRGTYKIDMQDANSIPQMFERVRGNGAVRSVAVTSRAPYQGGMSWLLLRNDNGKAMGAAYNFVSPEYIDLFRIPVLRGRVFTEREAAAGAPVAIISESAARRFWPDEDPLGRTVRVEAAGLRRERLPYTHVEIVGVMKDIVQGMVAQNSESNTLLLPIDCMNSRARSLLVRIDPGQSASVLTQMAGELWQRSGATAQSLQSALEFQFLPFQVGAALANVLGVLSLILTVSGIYGVMSYISSQRAKEVGIRLALGSTAGQVTGFLMRASLRLIGVGLLAGGALAAGVTHLLTSFFRMGPALGWSVGAFGGALAIVTLAALTASFIPSRRAASVDPATLLRTD